MYRLWLCKGDAIWTVVNRTISLQMRGTTPAEDVGYTFTDSLSKYNASGCSFSQKLSGLTDADSFCLVLEALTGQVVQYSNNPQS